MNNPSLIRHFLVWVLLGVVAGSSWAQEVPAAFAPGPNSKAILYKIALTDRLRIAVFQEDNLSTIARVDSKGNINLPLVGPVNVVNKSIDQAQIIVETAYQEGRFLRMPEVTITVEEYAPREVIVQGEVASPGRVPLPIESGMSVLDVISKAGGFTDVAKGEAVTITRVSPDGSKQVFTVDVQSFIKGRKNASAEESAMLLLPDDLVYVPIKFL